MHRLLLDQRKLFEILMNEQSLKCAFHFFLAKPMLNRHGYNLYNEEMNNRLITEKTSYKNKYTKEKQYQQSFCILHQLILPSIRYIWSFVKILSAVSAWYFKHFKKYFQQTLALYAMH